MSGEAQSTAVPQGQHQIMQCRPRWVRVNRRSGLTRGNMGATCGVTEEHDGAVGSGAQIGGFKARVGLSGERKFLAAPVRENARD